MKECEVYNLVTVRSIFNFVKGGLIKHPKPVLENQLHEQVSTLIKQPTIVQPL